MTLSYTTCLKCGRTVPVPYRHREFDDVPKADVDEEMQKRVAEWHTCRPKELRVV